VLVGSTAAHRKPDDLGEILIVASGGLAIFSAAADGAGPYSVPCTR
jgi:hypothetical protein